MRLLLVLHQFFPRHQTGTESYAYGVAQELNKRHDVFLYYREHTEIPGGREQLIFEEDVLVDGLRTHRVYLKRKGLHANPLTKFYDTYDCRFIEESFARYLDRIRPDVAHIQHLMFLSGDLIRLLRARRIPVVLTLHDYWFICANLQLVRPQQQICTSAPLRWGCAACVAASGNMPYIRLLAPILMFFFLRRDYYLRRRLMEVDQLVAPSEFLKSRFVQAGIPANRIQVLENGIDLKGLVQAKRVHSPLRVGFIGSIAWQKGVHVLVEAFNQISAPAELEIFGDDTVFPDYVQRVRRQARHPGIHFRGRFDHGDIWRVLSELDVLVVPSLWYENSPMVIREAFAAKVPVIASNLGALAEKVRDGVGGRLFNPGDVRALAALLQEIIENPCQLDILRSTIPPVKSIERHVLELESLYCHLVEQVRGAI